MCAIIFPVGMNGAVQMTAAGLPWFSKVMPSCTLHDEQDPQSPVAVTRTSHWSTISCMRSSGQGRLELRLSLTTISLN